MRRQIVVMVLSVLISMGLITGCSPAQEVKKEEPGKQTEVFLIKYGHAVPEAHHSHVAILEMKKYVEEKSGGRIKMEVYPNAVLGSDRQLIESCQVGIIQMTHAASAPFAAFSKPTMVFDLPYMFKSTEQAYKILDGPIGQDILDGLAKFGFKGLTYGINGFRMITNNVRPIAEPEDLTGLKIRTMENPVHIATFKAWKANPTPMAFGEVYTALQQGTVDGQENPLSLIYTNRFYEVQKYLSLTGHFFQPQIEVINLDFWNKLPKDLQDIVLEGSILRRDVQRTLVDAQDKEAIEIIKKYSQINEVSPQAKERFKQAAIGVYDQFKNEIGASLVDRMLEATK